MEIKILGPGGLPQLRETAGKRNRGAEEDRHGSNNH